MDVVRILDFDPRARCRAHEPATRHVEPAARGFVRIGHLSDIHLGKPIDDVPRLACLGWWVDGFTAARCDVLVVSGDLVETPDDTVGLSRVHDVLASAKRPILAVPGNHDRLEPGASGAFERLFGACPRVETHAGVDFVLLDSMAGPPRARRTPEELAECRRSGAFSLGEVGAEQLARARALLRGHHGRPRVLVVHHHLARPEDDTPGASPRDDLDLMRPLLDADAVLRWCAEQNIALVLHGHHHPYMPPYVRNDTTLVLSGGSITRSGFPKRARIVDLHPDGRRRVWELVIERG